MCDDNLLVIREYKQDVFLRMNVIHFKCELLWLTTVSIYEWCSSIRHLSEPMSHMIVAKETDDDNLGDTVYERAMKV